MFLIKLRIIAAYSWSRALFKTDTAGAFHEVQPIIQELVLGDEAGAVEFEKQNCMLQRLMDAIDSANRAILPALLNPEPL